MLRLLLDRRGVAWSGLGVVAAVALLASSAVPVPVLLLGCVALVVVVVALALLLALAVLRRLLLRRDGSDGGRGQREELVDERGHRRAAAPIGRPPLPGLDRECDRPRRCPVALHGLAQVRIPGRVLMKGLSVFRSCHLVDDRLHLVCCFAGLARHRTLDRHPYHELIGFNIYARGTALADLELAAALVSRWRGRESTRTEGSRIGSQQQGCEDDRSLSESRHHSMNGKMNLCLSS